MASRKISDMTSGAPAVNTDLLVIARGGANYRLTNLNLSTLVVTNLLGQTNTFTKGNATAQHTGAIVSSAYTPNCANSNVHRLVLTENITMNAPTNPLSGQVINLILKQDGTGGRTVTWNSIYKFPGGTDPTITSAASAVDVVTMQYDATDAVWYCVASQNFS